MPLPVITGGGGIMLSGRLYVCPSVTSISHDTISLYLVEEFNKTWHKYSPHECALIRRFTMWELKGQCHDQTINLQWHKPHLSFPSVCLSPLVYITSAPACNYYCSNLLLNNRKSKNAINKKITTAAAAAVAAVPWASAVCDSEFVSSSSANTASRRLCAFGKSSPT